MSARKALLPAGTVVTVRPPRVGPDGFEGVFTVVRPMPPSDYYLVRGAVDVSRLNEGDYDVIIHEQRVSIIGCDLCGDGAVDSGLCPVCEEGMEAES